MKSIFILLKGTFKTVAAIKTYLFTLTKFSQDKIEIGTLTLAKEIFQVEYKKQMKTKEFLFHEDWRVELLLSGADENIKKFKNSSLEKVKLKDVAEVFRGKFIMKKDSTVMIIRTFIVREIG